MLKIEKGRSDDIKKILNFLGTKIKEDDFNELRIKEELHTILWNSIFDVNQKILNLSNYKKLMIDNYEFLLKKEEDISDIKLKILSTLHKNLYPWIYGFRYKNLGELINSFNGKGIVICAYNRYFHFVKSNIEIFKNIFNSSLPIEIFYNGDKDLSLENRISLKQY